MRLEDDFGLLLARTHRAMRSQFAGRLNAHGIKFEQYQALLALSQGDGIAQHVVGERLSLEPTYTARMLRRAEKAGLVTRPRDPLDARVRNVHLTARGRATWLAAQQVRDHNLPQAISGLTQEERRELRRLLNKLHHHVTQLGQQPSSSTSVSSGGDHVVR
jgi:MarR family transcriptional regulator for hemolysin